jgi:hypothetical protein
MLNTHDRWLRYCHTQESVVSATGLPSELFRRADAFEHFLEHGSFRASTGAETLLTEMNDTAFLALEKVVNGYFDFQERYPALQRERYARFQRYG